MTYHSLKKPFEGMEDQLFDIIGKTYGYKGFEKIMDSHYEIEDQIDKNFEFGKGAAIGLFAGMGLACIAFPVALEIALETPVRATYESIKKVKDFYPRF
ncbi:MAG: hypothetical protein KAT28_04250 [Candidatus Aenigmarchaeota archaeon]|nr:hypothetical protein [Candidatus Aenigmarchaeota archaeon]